MKFASNELVVIKSGDEYHNGIGRTSYFLRQDQPIENDTINVRFFDWFNNNISINISTTKILSWGAEFNRICRVHGVTRQKDILLLQEAYRRRMMFQENRILANAWLGFGTLSEYKSDLFQTIGERTPRIVHWWKLTHKGVMLLSNLISELPFPETMVAKNELNNILYGCA